MYLKINNLNIYYQKVGHGPNLVMLHGWGQDCSTFWPLVDLLKDTFTLWLLDLPGFGRSDLPNKPFTVSDYAETVKEFIEQNQIKQPALLGHSMGGRIGVKLAAKYPKLLKKLILEDSAGIRTIPMYKEVVLAILAKACKYLIPLPFNLRTKARHLLYTLLKSDYENVGAARDTFINLTKEDLTPDLAKIKTETLILWGENDQAVPPSDGKKMYRLIPNSRIEVIDEAGHFPHLEKPKIFVHFLKDFCDEALAEPSLRA